MPIYNQPLQLVPTEYIPLDYKHEAQFYLSELDQAATNVAKVKSRYEDLLGMDLSNDLSKNDLSSFMKGAEEELKSLSGMDMLVGSTVTQAMDVLKPLTKMDGPYGHILIDNAFTKTWNGQKSLAGESKYKDKGEGYNEAAEKNLDVTMARFKNTTNVNEWKYLLNNMDEYTPYYDTQKEDAELIKNFKPSHIVTNEVDEKGHLIKMTDSSVYQQQLQEYLEANHSEKYRRQKAIEAQAEFGQYQMSSVNAKTKEYNSKPVIDYYSKLFNQNKEAKLTSYKDYKNSLARQSALLPNTTEGLKQKEAMNTKITNISTLISNTEKETFDAKPFMDLGDYKTAEKIAMGLTYDNDILKKAIANSYTNYDADITTDQAWFESAKLDQEDRKLKQDWDKHVDQMNLEYSKLGMKYGETGLLGGGNVGNLVTDTRTDIPEMDNDADRGIYQLKQSQSQIDNILGEQTAKVVDLVFGVNYSNLVSEISSPTKATKYSDNTPWGEIIAKNQDLNNPTFNQYITAAYNKINGTNVSFEDIKRLPFNQVKYTLTRGLNSPADRAMLPKSANIVDFSKIDAIYQQGISLQSSLVSAVNESKQNTILDGKPRTITVPIIVEGRTVNQTTKQIKVDSSKLSNSIISNKELLTEAILNQNGYTKASSGYEGAKKAIQPLVDEFYTNFYKNHSTLSTTAYHEEAMAPSTRSYEDIQKDENLKAQWTAYRNKNLNYIKTAAKEGTQSEKTISKLVSQFPEVFIPKLDQNGLTFKVNEEYVASSMSPAERERLYSTIDDLTKRSGFWTSIVSDNTDLPEEVTEYFNQAMAESPEQFVLHVPGLNTARYYNDNTAQHLYNGGVIKVTPITVSGYESTINSNPLTLKIRNYGASNTSDANPMITGSGFKPDIGATGAFTRENGTVKVVPIPTGEMNSYETNQMLGNATGVMSDLLTKVNSWHTIINSLNTTYTKANNMNDLYVLSYKNNDVSLQSAIEYMYPDIKSKLNQLLSK